VTSTQDRWIELADFTAGIYGDFHSGTTARAAVVKNGAATVENTYRCLCDPDGGLVPAPRTDGNWVSDQTWVQATPTANLWPAWPNMYLVDVQVGSPLRLNAASVQRKEFQPTVTAMFVAMASRTGVNPYGQVVRVTEFTPRLTGTAGAVGVDYLWESSIDTYTFNSPNAIDQILPGGNLTTYRSTSAAGGPPIPLANINGGVMGSCSISVNHAAAAIPATELGWTNYDLISPNYPTGVSAKYLAGVAFAAPDPAVPFGYSVWIPTVATNYMGPMFTVGHQGRMVVLRGLGAGYGGGPAYQQDAAWYTPPLDLKGLVYTSGTAEDQWTDDNISSGVVFGASVANDELFLVREGQGGILVRGDLDNPTVQRLSGVVGTGGRFTTPTNSPIGLVYATRWGVYAWNGGEVSQLLSGQLDGAFWWPYKLGERFGSAPTGRLAYWNDLILVPNNYAYDTRIQSWWRLEDPAALSDIPFICYAVDPPTGALFAFPAWYNVNGAKLFRSYDATFLATSYSWQSQPLIESRDRVLAVRELELTVSPGSNVNTDQTVAVTITGYDDTGAPTTATKTFTFSGVNGAQPIILRGDLSAELQGRYIQVRFLTSGGATGGGNGNAPKILNCRLATRDNQQPRKL
jgi:hypothetical protein